MVGDVAAAYSTAETAMLNPANAAFVDRTQGMGAFEAFKDSTLSMRYPGTDAIIDHKTGLGDVLGGGVPAGVLKIGPRFGIGGFIIPPGISVNLTLRKIPVILLGQPNFADIDVRGTENAVAGFGMAYRIGDRFSVGIGGNIRSIAFNADIRPSEGGASLASVDGSMMDLNALFGVKIDLIPGRLAVGGAVTTLALHDEKATVDSPLLGAVPADSDLSGSTSSHEINPLAQLTVGYQLTFSRLRIMGDLRYTRANTQREAFSLVDLKKKTRDLHDTVAISTGDIIQASDKLALMGGYRNEPSPVGQGSRSTADDPGLSGFGTIDIAQVYVGVLPLTPYWQVAGGFQIGLLPHTGLSEGKERRDHFYSLTFAAGLGYREASLGIDADGEQPAAYLQKKYFVPMAITIRL